tara:strand:- start:1133 stop:1891 length:759 start_codon:yes stop_codon:yes gene_type:complete
LVKKIILITQARIGSTRFPGKVLKTIGSSTILGVHLHRLKKSKLIDHIIVATTKESESEEIISISRKEKVEFFKGSTNDVLDRFYNAAKPYDPDFVVRVTSDCPLIDPKLIDSIIKTAVDKGIDYCSNVLDLSYPDGQDIEVFKFSVLKDAWLNSNLKSEREHVTPFIIKNTDFKGGNLYKSLNYSLKTKFSQIRMTVDEKEDLITIKYLINQLGIDNDWIEYAKYIIENPEMFKNQNIARNEGYNESLKND